MPPFLEQLEADASLFDRNELRRRIDALDRIDAYPPTQRADAMRKRLEAANTAVYAEIREGIRHSTARNALLPWLDRCSIPAEAPPAGLHYDCLDELIGGVLQLRQPDDAHIQAAPEMVFYQPTPARHILYMLDLCALTKEDTLVDLGSGLGHVPILASLLTPARCIGIELEPAYIATARECARSLGLSRAEFVRQDAREADLSAATVVYLYTPFTGSILETVLRQLRERSAHRALRICTFGPCTEIVAKEPWLTRDTAISPDRIALFRAAS